MKKLFLTISAALALLVMLPSPALAQQSLGQQISGQVKASEQTAGVDGSADPQEIITSVIKIGLSVVGIGFTILMVMAGFWWATAKGEEAKVEKAQTTIRTAVIGLIVVLGAYSITLLIGKITQTSLDRNEQIRQTTPDGETYDTLFDEWGG
ncbi:MAG: hypothetical protein HOE53_00690 [Candidatus Magasanikbacteria bacterium]|jgi:hypothetical protein|nr:hypothetical protein [Candidatus Magasanikbacteria bacterium]